MPGVICGPNLPQDCALLGQSYQSSSYQSNTIQSQRTQVQKTCGTSSPPFPTHVEEYGTSAGSGHTLLSVSSLLLLSPEVVLLVLANLPGRDILHCRLVCRVLRQFIDQSVNLQYIIHAHARGLDPLRHGCFAHLLLSRLWSWERNWMAFGALPYRQLTIKTQAEGHAPYFIYSSGEVSVYHGQHVTVHALRSGETCGGEALDLEGISYNSVSSSDEWFGFSSHEAVHIYSNLTRAVIRTLFAPQRGAIGPAQFRGGIVAAMFRPERRCGGVLIWDGNRGSLIATLLSTHTPALSFTFCNDTTLAVVRTDRSARSAWIELYEIGLSGAILRSSLSLPDASPTKWYAKADIHCDNSTVRTGTERVMDNEGIVAVDLELRIRSPHDPTTNTTDRRLSVILVIDRWVLANASVLGSNNGRPVPWRTWSPGRFRFLTGVRMSSHSSVWGRRLIALGPEVDKISLYDFCPVGVQAAARVWDPACRRVSVSVRAAIAQRARTLVRSNDLGIGTRWFDNTRSVAVQMPYVVSIRRGMVNVCDAWLDADHVVVLKNDERSENASRHIIWFDFSTE